MHGEMRIGIARAQSAGLRVDELAVVRKPAELFRLDRDAPQRVDQPELGQLAAAVRQQVDADAELAEADSIEPSTLSHILRRLERAKLVEKTRQDHDNRSVRVATTAKGRALAKKCHDTAVRHDRLLTHGLRAAEVRALKGAL